MLGPYLGVLKLDGSWRFSLAGLILRLPTSMTSISAVLLIKASYGSYSLADLMAILNVIATALCAPIITRYADHLGQRKVMGPLLTIEVTTSVTFLLTAIVHASSVLVALITVITGTTWGVLGAFVRARWTNALKGQSEGLTTAFVLEFAIDEFVYILGPVLSTVLDTPFHPGVGLVLICLSLGIGEFWFFSQSASKPVPCPKAKGEHRQSVLRSPAVVVMILTYITMGSMFGVNNVAVVAFAAALDTPSMSSVLPAFFSIGLLLAGPWYSLRRWTQSLWSLFAFSIVLLAVGTSAYLLAHSIPVMALVMTLTGITYAPTVTNVNTVIARIVAPERPTEGLAWVDTSLNIGLSLDSAMASPVIDASGVRSDYFVMVGVAWVIVAIMVLGLPSLHRTATSLHPRIEE